MRYFNSLFHAKSLKAGIYFIFIAQFKGSVATCGYGYCIGQWTCWEEPKPQMKWLYRESEFSSSLLSLPHLPSLSPSVFSFSLSLPYLVPLPERAKKVNDQWRPLWMLWVSGFSWKRKTDKFHGRMQGKAQLTGNSQKSQKQ